MSRRNAKQELISALSTFAKIKCASIIKEVYYANDDRQSFNLKVNHTPEDYANFLNKLDFEYDAGYGSQNLDGIVWLEDGTWLSRGEYDGSEWWEFNKLPNIPSELL
jgi:hypothetical protein